MRKFVRERTWKREMEEEKEAEEKHASDVVDEGSFTFSFEINLKEIL